MPQPEPSSPAAVAWDWRRSAAGTDGAEALARERAQARRRGLIQAVVGLAVAGLFAWLHRPILASIVAGIALLSLVLALAFPTTAYRQLSRALEAFGHGVGVAVTWVLMTLLYFLLFLPVGLALRLARRLGITTGPDRALASYWSAAPGTARGLDAYRKQF